MKQYLRFALAASLSVCMLTACSTAKPDPVTSPTQTVEASPSSSGTVEATPGASEAPAEQAAAESTPDPTSVAPEATPDPSANAFPAFSTQDLEGNAVDASIFSKQSITMINIWGTYCGPCIREMPDLGKLAKSMPKGSQLIGLVIDIDGNEQVAKDILKEADATTNFIQLKPDTALMDYIQQNIVGVPTSIFVDTKGNIVGQPIVGSSTEADYRKAIEAHLGL